MRRRISRSTRIAYLTARFPFPPVGGDRIRVYYTLRHLLRAHEVTLYTTASRVELDGPRRHPDLPGLRQRVFSLGRAGYVWNGARALLSSLPLRVMLYECADFVRALDADIRSGAFDLLFVHLLRMAEYVRPYHHLPRVLDMADSIYQHYARMRKISWSPWWLGARLDCERIRHYKAYIPGWFHSVLIHTEEKLEWGAGSPRQQI